MLSLAFALLPLLPAPGGSLCVGAEDAPPHLEVHRPVISHDLAPEGLRLGGGWSTDWVDLTRLCQVEVKDDCSRQDHLVVAITGVTSSRADEAISGRPGYFSSPGLIADDRGALFNLSEGLGPRRYTFQLAALDTSGHRAEATCTIALEQLTLDDATLRPDGLHLRYTKSFEACVTVQGLPGAPELCASGDQVEVVLPRPASRLRRAMGTPIKLCHSADRSVCSAPIPLVRRA